MGSEWREVTLGDASLSVQTGPFGSQLHKADYVEEGIPSIMPVNISDNRITTEGIARITKEDAERLSKYRVKTGDVVYSRRGDVERRALVRENEDGWLCGTGCLRVRFNKDCVDPAYASFQLGSARCREWIVRHAIGATMPNLNTSILSAVPFILPPLPEQKAIAHILGTLDDKIELNRRMNATLEGMAQALFKSWFVDFDPVIDNALAAGNPIPDELTARAEVRRQALASSGELCRTNGTTQQGSLDHPTLSDPKSLFPAAFEFSDELGPIPKGWNTRKLSELATVTKGKSYKSSELQASTTALVTLKSFIRGGGYRLDGLKEYTGIYKPEQVVESGDLIISYTDVTQAADVIGKPAMVIPDERYETLVISLDVGVVRPSEPTLKHFLYQLARTKRFEDWMLSHTSGTTVLHLSKNAFPSFECAFPDEKLISEFQKIVSPLFERTVQNVKESRVLIKLRDTLLPKLISGELRIPEA